MTSKIESILTDRHKPTTYPALVTRSSGTIALATSPTTGVLLFSTVHDPNKIGTQMGHDEGVTWATSPKGWYCIKEPVTLTLHTP